MLVFNGSCTCLFCLSFCLCFSFYCDYDRPGSLEVPHKKSPTATPRTARKLKTADTDPVSSPNPKIRTSKAQSPKVVAGRGSPRTPINEVPVAFCTLLLLIISSLPI